MKATGKSWKTVIGATRWVAVSMALLALAAGAQEPGSSAPLHLIVPFGPGGPTDVIARVLAPKLGALLHQNVVVENRSGAGSAIGARYVAAATPDGNTLLLGNVSTYSIIPAVTVEPGFDPVKSFVPIAKIADVGLAIIAGKGVPATSIKELVALARAKPGQISFSSGGVGNSVQLLAEVLQSEAKVQFTHVPYRGGAESATAVLSGQVQFSMVDLTVALHLIREGRVKALAVTTPARVAELPEVPTVAQAGYPDLAFSNWTGVAAPAKTSPAAVERLARALNGAVRSSDFQTYIKEMGGEAPGGTSEEFAALIGAEFVRWRNVAAAANISLK